jgi:hypothetical protein
MKRLWVRIGETLKRLRSTSAGRWWLVWVSGGTKWVLGSSKATNVACLAVYNLRSDSALSFSATRMRRKKLYGPIWPSMLESDL